MNFYNHKFFSAPEVNTAGITKLTYIGFSIQGSTNISKRLWLISMYNPTFKSISVNIFQPNTKYKKFVMVCNECLANPLSPKPEGHYTRHSHTTLIYFLRALHQTSSESVVADTFHFEGT